MPWQAVAIAAGAQLIGGLSARSSAKKAQNKEEAFLKKKYDEYDFPLWEMQGERLIADRDELIRGIKLKQANELKLAAFKDKNNLRNYQQQLKIRSYQIDQQNRLFNKSERLYGQSIQQANEQAARQWRETKQKFAFQNEDRIIESIQKKGELAVKSQSGKSAAKAFQTELYTRGRETAILTESLISANEQTRSQLKDFYRKADAQRMLRPEAPPEPLKPLPTPVADYEMPRALQDFDFGPQPIKGVSTVQVPSFGSVLAGAASAGFSAYSAATAGTSSFPGGGGTGMIGGTSGYGSFSTSTSDATSWSSLAKAGFPSLNQ